VSVGRHAVVVGAVIATSLAAVFPAVAPESRPAVVFGSLLAGANALAAHFLAVWSAPRSTSVFMRAVLGGMVGRMFVMLAAFLGGTLGFGLRPVPLAIALLSYFVLFLVFELVLLSRAAERAGVP
jgi:hypothetical protein